MQQTFVRAKRKLAEVLSAFEFLDSSALDLTLHQLPHIINPLPDHQVRNRIQLLCPSMSPSVRVTRLLIAESFALDLKVHIYLVAACVSHRLAPFMEP